MSNTWSPDTLFKLDAFTGRVNLSDPQEYDYDRFREFVIQAHHDDAPIIDLTDDFEQRGFPREPATHWGARYVDARRLLRLYALRHT
jgi:hypothetical protein